MNLTVWVDVAIGLTLAYLGASLFVTLINEYIAQTVNSKTAPDNNVPMDIKRYGAAM